ncbi:nuclear transport factor 2 family protein [Thalassotalea sp. HSM 43]|uniref:nuclear transport factor 2 family protein n=1 Tax=Thalassotalea sp. HSM 43 TaxID=2552945 RepID=UPI0010811A60|nr:nuclear transport factor 2 family protein [Thalassotalea sp. HSM 43]QBY04202.1 nuclear transport factor 2 family protein [Thalassotalea sp. HSM 43]
MTITQKNKQLILDFYQQLEAADEHTVVDVLKHNTADDYQFFGVHPFNEQLGCEAVAEVFWQPFMRAFKNIQRRQDVFMAGESGDGSQWVTSMGHFMALFDNDWLGIPKSKKVIMIRYADFNRIENGKITQTGLFIDIIQVMNQVGINPLTIETGHSFIYPGPRTHDGVMLEDKDPAEAAKTIAVLNKMIEDLSNLNETADDNYPPEILAKSWSENMVWYGPAGIGASYTIRRYQHQHSYPFRQGLSDKVFNGHICRYAEGNYACFFGWPNLSNTPSGGFLGLPGGKRADMRVVDVYRRDGDKLEENWVIIDIPYWLKQQGLDILERTKSIVNPD